MSYRSDDRQAVTSVTVWEVPSASQQLPVPTRGRGGHLRRSLATAAVLVLWMGLVAGWFSLTSAGGDDNGRIWAAVAYLPAAVISGAIWWRRPPCWPLAAATALLAVTAGIVTGDRSPAGAGVLTRALNDVQLPNGARLLGQELRDIGFGSGSELTRWVAVPATPAIAAATFQTALASAKFSQDGAGLDGHGRWVRGRVAVVFRVGAKDVFLGGVPGNPGGSETVLYIVAASR